jgi:anti-sigma regulatory factor (Ser/Thr protein kinase)
MQMLLSLKLPAKLENLRRFMNSVSDCARAEGFGQKRIDEIELALEEILVNILSHRATLKCTANRKPAA